MQFSFGDSGINQSHHVLRGDVIVLPSGDQHTMGGKSKADVVPIASLICPVPWKQFQRIRYGAGSSRTDVICGYLDTVGPLFDPSLRALPPVFVVHPNEATSDWVRVSIEYAVENSAAADESVGIRIPELLLNEILQIHTASRNSNGESLIWQHSHLSPEGCSTNDSATY